MLALTLLLLHHQAGFQPDIEGKWISVGIRHITLDIKREKGDKYKVDFYTVECFGDVSGHRHGTYKNGMITLDNVIQEDDDYETAKLHVVELLSGVYLVKDTQFKDFKKKSSAIEYRNRVDALSVFSYAFTHPETRSNFLDSLRDSP